MIMYEFVLQYIVRFVSNMNDTMLFASSKNDSGRFIWYT